MWFQVHKNNDPHDSSSDDSNDSPNTFYYIQSEIPSKVHYYIAAGIALRIERSFSKEKRWRWSKEQSFTRQSYSIFDVRP